MTAMFIYGKTDKPILWNSDRLQMKYPWDKIIQICEHHWELTPKTPDLTFYETHVNVFLSGTT